MLFYDRTGKVRELLYEDCTSWSEFYERLCLIKFGKPVGRERLSPDGLVDLTNMSR